MITRDAFLYMDPKPPYESFGQCSTCIMWTGPKHKMCTIHGPTIEILGRDSCGLYVHGKPMPEEVAEGEIFRAVSPSESGLVRRQIRCENCAAYLPLTNKCNLFVTLNRKLPDLFNLNEIVHPEGCCNAQQPKGLLGR